MLGRSYSTLSRERNRIKPIVTKPPSADQKKEDDEDFYDSVYNDKADTMTTNVDSSVGPEVEEVYDDGMGINPDEIYDAVASVKGQDDDDDSFNDSFESSGDESIYDKADLGLDIHF